ncbi:hypothetical protein HAX54_032976 [Datura stramonium]|uniref:Uncharacterized protein n=1 Tax=Datura stramonium TaxID=4076 RepID=A0ABS8VEI6_DATST|nr:hypothetical protein [Datura stramonium]
MSEESVNAPVPIIDLDSDGETKEIAKIDERTALTRKRIADAERRIANIIKTSDKISGFGHRTRRLANKGKDKMETSLSGERTGFQAQTKEGNSQGITKRPISLKVFHHQCRSEVVSCSYLYEALCVFEEPYHIIFQKLMDAQLIHPIGKRRKRPLRRWETVKECPYHLGMLGHDISECHMFKFDFGAPNSHGRHFGSYSRQVTTEIRAEGTEHIG